MPHTRLDTAPAADPPVTLHVAGDTWRFAIAGVTRVGRDLFISVVLTGPELCTAVVHVREQVVPGVTARQILDRTCEWLVRRRGDRHAYIELCEAA